MSTDAIRAFGRKLARSERLSGEELRAYQAPLLARLLIQVRATTEFYEDRIDFDLSSPESIERNWSGIPILRRAEAVANAGRLTSASMPPEAGPAKHAETSGSIGMPFRFRRSAVMDLVDNGLTERMYRWWRVDGKKSLAQISYDRDKLAPTVRGLTTRGWHSARPNGTRYFLSHAFDIDTQLDWLAARSPNYLGAYSSILKGLAAASKRRGIALKFDLIFSFATVLDQDTRALCRAVFDAEIADTYGTQEVGHIAAQCRDCGEYHVSAEACLVEILRDDGSPVAPGEIGRVIVTPLYNYAMPFIRYEVGDLAELGTPNPSCGRGLPSLRRILGRYRNLFRFRDGTTRWPVGADFRFDEFSARQFQVIQTDFDHIEIRYIADPDGRPMDLPVVTERVRSALHQPVEVSLRAVETIERSRSGKFEDFISMVPPE